ncbi:MAG: Glu/Leu/Phe/Val dehydrogenase [Candidatus Diapherotrites archaeon]|jgi:glutamate dehydrogenase/leucine dehydrogenase|nr:Glu/Leu/Phe/Val dehydrogenase [Candidatus Diapherotrites archaeon]MBT4596352.1 Glu/Leu/Phe/Val dehydrogenase [Candidatus Diapherotrites archaeon]
MNEFDYDILGPEKILEVHDPKTGMKGFVVIDSTVLGVGKGGIRMTPTVDKEEVFRLARTMTLKNSLAGLPFGGAKSGIIADAHQLSLSEKKKLVESFASALKELCPAQYVAAPDISMSEREMEWFSKKLKSRKACTGKPKKMGGLPHELGSTGLGVAVATEVAVKSLGKKLKGMTLAVEGFGNVGTFATKFLTEKGAKLIAVSDSHGCLKDASGIDYEKLMKVKKKTRSVVNYSIKKPLICPGIISVDADILITAAIPDLIKTSDVEKVRAKIIVQGSNIPMSEQTEELLHKRKVLVVPDFVANAGGVISSYVEYIGGNEKKMFKMVEDKIRTNTKLVLAQAKKKRTYPRKAALAIAEERLLAKCKCKK